MKHTANIILVLTLALMLNLTVCSGCFCSALAMSKSEYKDTLVDIAVVFDTNKLMADVDFAKLRKEHRSNQEAMDCWLSLVHERIAPVIKQYMTVDDVYIWLTTNVVVMGTATLSTRELLLMIPEVVEVRSRFDIPDDLVYFVMFGDLDLNGRVTAADARLALRASARLEKLSAARFLAGDLNGDGQITAAEARKILRVSAKIDNLSKLG